jgi:hypothetical protein
LGGPHERRAVVTTEHLRSASEEISGQRSELRHRSRHVSNADDRRPRTEKRPRFDSGFGEDVDPRLLEDESRSYFMRRETPHPADEISTKSKGRDRRT